MIARARMKDQPFEPRIHGKGNEMTYEDNRVFGSIDVWDREGVEALTIYGWSSSEGGKGHTVAALEWLRRKFPFIAVADIGKIEDGVPDDSAAYWIRMRSKGLVDHLMLDDMSVVPDDVVPDGPKP